MFCNTVLTNRLVGSDSFFVLGGTLTSPFIFVLDNIVAEIYGYRVAQFMIISAFIVLTIFVIICQSIIFAPYPAIFKEQHAYFYVLGPNFFRIEMSGFVAYIISNLLNSYIISRWKILVKGRIFWIRNLGASAFSEILFSFLAVFMMELHSIPVNNILRIIIISCVIKIIFTLCFSYPAQVLVNYLKKLTGIDVYDFKNEFTPAKFLHDHLD